MWSYEKRLQYPVNITTPNAKLAEVIISQYGGPDGEMGASMRYLSQRYGVPYPEIAAVLTDIGTEELAHLEMVAAIVHQLTKNLSMEEIENSGFKAYYVDRTTYDNILRLIKDPEVCDPIRFLRQREVVHFQRFGEALRLLQEKLDPKNFYICNPEFDSNCGCNCK